MSALVDSKAECLDAGRWIKEQIRRIWLGPSEHVGKAVNNADQIMLVLMPLHRNLSVLRSLIVNIGMALQLARQSAERLVQSNGLVRYPWAFRSEVLQDVAI